jgi:hypothetical protein
MPSFSVFRVPSAVSDYKLTHELGVAAGAVLDSLSPGEKADVLVEVWKLRRKWPFLTVSDALAVLAVSGGQISWRYH